MTDDSKVFRALADPTRRLLLDLLNERDGRTLYRTAFTGFAREDAQAFCAALKAAGHTCLVK